MFGLQGESQRLLQTPYKWLCPLSQCHESNSHVSWKRFAAYMGNPVLPLLILATLSLQACIIITSSFPFLCLFVHPSLCLWFSFLSWCFVNILWKIISHLPTETWHSELHKSFASFVYSKQCAWLNSVSFQQNHNQDAKSIFYFVLYKSQVPPLCHCATHLWLCLNI